jgi:hypothetical protein
MGVRITAAGRCGNTIVRRYMLAKYCVANVLPAIRCDQSFIFDFHGKERGLRIIVDQTSRQNKRSFSKKRD